MPEGDVPVVQVDVTPEAPPITMKVDVSPPIDSKPMSEDDLMRLKKINFKKKVSGNQQSNQHFFFDLYQGNSFRQGKAFASES